jgi:uncharacterized protein
MERDRVLSMLRDRWDILQTLGVKSLALFGSVARDEAGANSDIDFLVEFALPLTFDRYMDVKFFLEDLLEKQVDLVTWRSLKPQLREVVKGEVVYVA